MSVAVVVPFRGGCPYREAAWAHVRHLYEERHPDWEVVEAPAPDGPWCKGAAVNRAVAGSGAEIVVLADADVWVDGLAEGIVAVEGGAPWAVPHLQVHRLDELGSRAVLEGEPCQGQPVVQKPYQGVWGGGFVVAPRTVLEAVPIDERFVGWGQEDECHAVALSTLVGAAWRGSADLWHLWHPPQERMTRRRGSKANWELRCRYMKARNNPAVMAALVEEGRGALKAHQHPLHDHAETSVV